MHQLPATGDRPDAEACPLGAQFNDRVLRLVADDAEQLFAGGAPFADELTVAASAAALLSKVSSSSGRLEESLALCTCQPSSQGPGSMPLMYVWRW